MKVYNIKVDLKDILALLFRKKQCHECSKVLRRRIATVPKGPKWDATIAPNRLIVERLENVDLYIHYVCDSCYKEIRPRELW